MRAFKESFPTHREFHAVSIPRPRLRSRGLMIAASNAYTAQMNIVKYFTLVVLAAVALGVSACCHNETPPPAPPPAPTGKETISK
jgi:hypothetical protein